MSRFVELGVAVALAVPLTTAADTRTLQQRALNEPVGIAVPSTGVAGVEEPTALAVNPAGVGFVDDFTLQYFHEGRSGTGLGADGFWAATPIGPVVPAFSMQWIRPWDGGGSRFRKTSFGLALPIAGIASLSVAGNWFASPDPGLDKLWSLDAGLTVRPWQHLSLAVAVLGMNANLAGQRLPIRYDFGVATRVWRDRLTLSADLLTDDQARDDLVAQAAALALGIEVAYGVALQAQVQFPVRSGLTGPAGSSYGQLTLTYNLPHVGVTIGGGTGDDATRTWLVGARVSAQRYLAPEPRAAEQVDLAQALSQPRSIFGGERERYEKLLRRLTAARDNPSTPALIVKIDDLSVGQGRIEELRRLLLDVKSRKPVVAYLSGGGMKEYYLASAASVVLAPPAADVFPNGLSSSTLFVKNTLGKVGVTVDVVAIGKYKNAPDPLIREDMSEGQREVVTSVLDDVFGRQVRGIAETRGLSEARVRELVDTGIFTAEQAVEAKLIDATAWPDELGRAASQLAGERLAVATSRDESELRAAQHWGPRHAVALVRVDGAIAQGKSRSDPFGAVEIAGSDTIGKLIQSAASDRDVIAIVLRIDSPGGDSLASDLIWREVIRARRTGKPVVVSMGDLAASGGYLVAVGADAILAEPSTLTGSIGVFALKPDFSGLLGKIGANVVTTTRGRHADLLSLTRPWTAEERSLIEKQVKAFYDLFLVRVASGRAMTPERVDAVARGRVWTGAQAIERGLVDRIGSLDDAIQLAKEKAGYGDDRHVTVKAFEPERSLLREIVGGLVGGEQPAVIAALSRIPELRAATLLLEMGPVLAFPPEWIGVEVEP